MHVKWAMELILSIIKDQTLMSSRDTNKTVGILLLPIYRAQYVQYQLAIDKMVEDKSISKEEAGRIRLHTLDSSQGDEEDVVVVDMTRTDGPGFCGDKHRICILLTRARIGQVTILNKGMWMTTRSTDAEGACNLKQVHRQHGDCVTSVPTCDRCQTFHNHQTVDCKAPARVDNAIEHCQIRDCGEDGHTAEACPQKKCSNCLEKGHAPNECKESATCPRCFDPDHIVFWVFAGFKVWSLPVFRPPDQRLHRAENV